MLKLMLHFYSLMITSEAADRFILFIDLLIYLLIYSFIYLFIYLFTTNILTKPLKTLCSVVSETKFKNISRTSSG